MERLHDEHVQQKSRATRDGQAGLHRGFYGQNYVESWLRQRRVTPREAALLFFGYMPSKFKDSLPYTGDQFTDEHPFDTMLRWFGDVAHDGAIRSLRDWVLVAQELADRGASYIGWKACIDNADESQTEPSPEPRTPVVTTGKRWTPKKLAELNAYRESHTMPETAAHFGVSEQRIRQLLPVKKPKAKPFDGLVKHIK